MADAEHVELQLQEALAAARSRGDAAQARTAYTQAGLAHYARQRYDEAIRCFEAQVRSIAAGPQVGDADLEALSFAFRLLAQLHMELGQEEHAGAYARRSKEVQVSVCLRGMAAALQQDPACALHATALRELLAPNAEDAAALLLHAPQFAVLLHTLRGGGPEVAHVVLQLLALALAQPLPQPPHRRLARVLAAVSARLAALIDAGACARPERRVVKAAVLVLRCLAHWAPGAFDDRVPLAALDGFLRLHLAPSSSLLAIWAQAAGDIASSLGLDPAAPLALKPAPPKRPGPGAEAARPPPAPKVRLAHVDDTRSPSMLTDTSTYDSSETDTLTFFSVVSDEDDGSESTPAVGT